MTFDALPTLYKSPTAKVVLQAGDDHPPQQTWTVERQWLRQERRALMNGGNAGTKSRRSTLAKSPVYCFCAGAFIGIMLSCMLRQSRPAFYLESLDDAVPSLTQRQTDSPTTLLRIDVPPTDYDIKNQPNVTVRATTKLFAPTARQAQDVFIPTLPKYVTAWCAPFARWGGREPRNERTRAWFGPTSAWSRGTRPWSRGSATITFPKRFIGITRIKWHKDFDSFPRRPIDLCTFCQKRIISTRSGSERNIDSVLRMEERTTRGFWNGPMSIKARVLPCWDPIPRNSKMCSRRPKRMITLFNSISVMKWRGTIASLISAYIGL